MRNPILLAAAALAALSGCYMEVPSEVIEGRVVATRRDPAANFADFATFEINPLWTVYDGSGDPDASAVAMPPEIAARIRQNLEDRGYVEEPGTAELTVQVTAIIGQVDVWYPGYWCDPYWGYCYGWGSSYSYQVGTMVIDLNAQTAILWTATSYGVLFGPPIQYDLPYLLESVDRAFAQSPYIQAAP